MDYTPVESLFDPDEAMFDAPPGASWTRLPKRRQREGQTLRYRGMAYNLDTGVVILNDRQMRLAAPECDLLRALMRKAGQIISASRLAEQLGVTIAEVEARIRALSRSLADFNAPCMPRRVEGLGYILWR
jgi:DNA-binding response OmpR family regulator